MRDSATATSVSCAKGATRTGTLRAVKQLPAPRPARRLVRAPAAASASTGSCHLPRYLSCLLPNYLSVVALTPSYVARKQKGELCAQAKARRDGGGTGRDGG